MFHVRHHDQIGSTSDEAKRLAAEGAPHGTAVHADEQLMGRGRIGKTWHSPPGNLYLSVVLRLDVPPSRGGELSFVAALAVADTVDALLPKHMRAMLKWPNDVLVDSGKIAGILVEQIEGARIVGMGMNILEAPRNAPYKTTTIARSGGLATVDGARDILLARLEARLDSWIEEGFWPVREAWLARAHPIGTPLRANIGDRAETGTFGGLDADGALLLDTEDGRKRIVAGEIAV